MATKFLERENVASINAKHSSSRKFVASMISLVVIVAGVTYTLAGDLISSSRYSQITASNDESCSVVIQEISLLARAEGRAYSQLLPGVFARTSSWKADNAYSPLRNQEFTFEKENDHGVLRFTPDSQIRTIDTTYQHTWC
ncbi:hypothetical protein ACX80N_16810 [Arthrobacter sp. MDT2-16]